MYRASPVMIYLYKRKIEYCRKLSDLVRPNSHFSGFIEFKSHLRLLVMNYFPSYTAFTETKHCSLIFIVMFETSYIFSTTNSTFSHLHPSGCVNRIDPFSVSLVRKKFYSDNCYFKAAESILP